MMTSQTAHPRVVSLISSATEIVAGMGLANWLVGRSHECDNPPEIMSLPQLTEPKFNVDGSSGEIDGRVKDILRDGLAVYRVFDDQMLALKPDVILTQDQCDVCAVSLKDVEVAVRERSDCAAQIVSLKPDCLEDAYSDFRRVGQALGVPEKGVALADQVEGRILFLENKLGGNKLRPRIAFVEWIKPLMAGGNWMPELIAQAGGENLFGIAGQHSDRMEWEDLRSADPEIIVIAPCGFDIKRTREEMHEMEARPGWRELKAVRGGKVFIGDGNRYFNRPGPGLAETAEILAEILHPDIFDLGYGDRDFINYK